MVKFELEQTDDGGWKLSKDDRYALLSAGEVLEVLAAFMSLQRADYDGWFRTQEEHDKMDVILGEYLNQIKDDRSNS